MRVLSSKNKSFLRATTVRKKKEMENVGDRKEGIRSSSKVPLMMKPLFRITSSFQGGKKDATMSFYLPPEEMTKVFRKFLNYRRDLF